MSLASRLLGFLAAMGVAGALAHAVPLPPISGEIEGDLIALLPGAPKVHWRIAPQPPRDGVLTGSLSLKAPGTELHGAVTFNPEKNEGVWRLEPGRVEPGAWIGVVAVGVVPSLAGVVAEGAFLLSGEGTFREGQPAGRLSLEWTQGALKNPADKWALEGISLHAEFVFDAAAKTWASVGPLTLAVKTISTVRFGARDLLLVGTLDEHLVFNGRTARVDMAGGDVTIDPFRLPLSPPVVNVKVHFNRIGLQDVAALVPTGLAEARGRIDGEVQLSWSKAAGVQVGGGKLDLRSDEPAIVRLAPSPGLLTEQMPERFAFLPSWLGPLSRWLAPVNPAYADLKAIELGQRELRGQSLSVRLTPEGDPRGRTASLQMVARPEQAGSTVDRVNFEVDVTGPLSALFQLSMDDRTRLEFRR